MILHFNPEAVDSRQVCRNAVIIITKAIACLSASAATAITLHCEEYNRITLFFNIFHNPPSTVITHPLNPVRILYA